MGSGGMGKKSAPHYGPRPTSPTPSLTASLRELLQTGELNPEDAVFVGPVGVVTNPPVDGGSPGPSVLVMGERVKLEGELDRRGLTEEEAGAETPPLRWARKQRKGTAMGSTGSPVRKRRVVGLFSGLFGRGKGKGKAEEKADDGWG